MQQNLLAVLLLIPATLCQNATPPASAPPQPASTGNQPPVQAPNTRATTGASQNNVETFQATCKKDWLPISPKDLYYLSATDTDPATQQALRGIQPDTLSTVRDKAFCNESQRRNGFCELSSCQGQNPICKDCTRQVVDPKTYQLKDVPLESAECAASFSFEDGKNLCTTSDLIQATCKSCNTDSTLACSSCISLEDMASAQSTVNGQTQSTTNGQTQNTGAATSPANTDVQSTNTSQTGATQR